MEQSIAKVFNPNSDKEVGLDEAGRGALAGPVCVAGVILPKELETAEGITIRDSKKISEKKDLLL